jgi:hypothetical protein
MMDKKLARKNMRMGITLFVVLLCMLGITFIWAAIYLRAVPPSL